MELIRYLEAEVQKRSELDDLVDEFYHLIQRETFKKQVECFYETGITDFTNINKHVREHPTFPLRGGNSGVLVPKSSASLPGIDAHGLAVRHSMLSKYDDPEDPDFESVFSSLKRMIEKWESQRHDRVSLEGDPTGQLIFQFFAKSTSGGLADLSIQTTVFKARRLQFPDDSHQQSQWKFMEAASLKTISSLRITRESLTSTVNATATIAKSKVTNSEIGNKYLGEMQGNVNDVSKALQEILLLDSTIDTQSLQGDDFAKLLGVTHAMEAKQQIMETDSVIDVTRLHHKSIQFKKRIERSSRHSFYNASISGTSVLVETFRYDPERSTKTTLSDRRHNSVRRFVYQLSHDRRPIQNVLPCVGYYQEEEKKQVGLVYELGSDAKHISLTELYKKPTKKRPPLGYRLRLAYSLAMGLSGLHRVSWIYKELNSMNIRLIARNLIEGHANASRVDTSWPYPPEGFFFGFEWSRPHNIETDFATPLSSQTRIYRHPDRWLHPREEQKIAQDVYSLGVVLLEIMFWKAATDFTKPDLSGAIRTEIKSRMLTLLESDGPELVGDTFVAVVKTCLNFKELTDGCTPLESYQKFKSEVTEVLARLVDAKI
ncbi:hypothetical protein H9Q69_000255 [Fusarium xylarioides]|nr:hypothetical protein H9Q69_000255 [Fusarium xylarioides]